MKLFSTTLLVLGVAASSLLWSSSAHAQFFVNGNFEMENGLASGGAVGATTGSSTSTIQGWTTTIGNGRGANVYLNNVTTPQSWIPNPESGNYCVQLDGSQNANDAAFANDGSVLTPKRDTISQLFTEPVGSYTLSFYLNNEVGSGKGGTSGALVSLIGVANGTFTNIEDKITNPASVARAASTWTQFTANFTVTNASTPITLTFADDPNTALSNYTASSNIAIDNVTISAVPEPGTMVSLLAGFAGLSVVQRVRRRRAC